MTFKTFMPCENSFDLTSLKKQDACYTGITRDAGADSFIQLYASPIDKTILANGIV